MNDKSSSFDVTPTVSQINEYDVVDIMNADLYVS